MRVTCFATLVCAVLLGPVSGAPYHTGGSTPLLPEQQARLDRHAEHLSLGINTDWLATAKIDPELFTRAVDLIATGSEKGTINGALLYVDRLEQITMPVGIGYRIVDPERRGVEYSTLYEVHDLTGVLVTSLLAVGAISTGRIKADGRVESYLPQMAGSKVGGLTVEQLLRHESGLSADFPAGQIIRSREELLAQLSAWPTEPDPAKAEPSPADWILLGLILESVEQRPFRELAQEGFIDYLQLQTAAWGIQPDKRFTLAPGGKTPLFRHMAWGDPRDSFAQVLGTPSPHWGLTMSADDFSTVVRLLMALSVANQGVAWKDAPPASRLVIAPPEGHYNYAFRTGEYGTTSFGWDSEWGTSVWILPEKLGFVLLMTNDDHPTGETGKSLALRREAIGLLVQSLDAKWSATGVDSPGSAADASPPSKPTSPPGTP
ncbi:serine hydrolase [bacterium]|nr:serine hydrolase [bacterium]